MRVIAFLLPLLALGAAPSEPLPAPTAPIKSRLISPAPSCPDLQVAVGNRSGQFRKLTDLPPADAYQAVYRLGADGCIDPLLVSERVRGARQR